MDEPLYGLYRAALATMGDSEADRGPRPLFQTITSLATIDLVELNDDDEQTVWQTVMSDNPNEPTRLDFGRVIRRWDRFEEATWTAETQPYSVLRRELIYEKLSVPESCIEPCAVLFPIAKPPPRPIVIAAEHEEWYTHERQSQHRFYWSQFRKYLEQVAGWPEISIDSLDKVTTSIVERLSDPERAEIFSVRGLVVGYVQSGKTANFTAVAAKAADAGYRLIIILAGTLNVLRSQTQRRLDRELVGQEILEMTGNQEYVGDRDWPDKFVSFGGVPSEDGFFDWTRLTDSQTDYQRLRHGIQALEFVRTFPDRRFNDPANLHPSPARLIVIKKNPQVMQKLNEDLNRLRAALEEVPTLIVDDESDQASVNTLPPTSLEERQRTATNREIVNLLRILPRAQYIGYTATPFANVFVDPSDAEDLFPKDFIIGLPRPEGYMGVKDFFDFAEDGGDLTDEEIPEGFLSNELAFVRDVRGEDTEPQNLKRAILSFIVSGALKLFRAENNVSVSIDHHTMLVHKSVRQADHEQDAQQVEAVYHGLNIGSQAFYRELEAVWRDDFMSVSEVRAPYLPRPNDFRELRQFVDQCINKIQADETPVRIVNGDSRYADQIPDFDRQSVWGILVGGTKLSRGYTVEGLTVSYYRRRIKQADTLMQVGRWFGFRRGYKDLVRLFVGREEPDVRNEVFDLYLAFRSICQDEEAFRRQLDRYSLTDDGPRVLPRQVPPLVPAHMLRPTAANKMYNATVAFQNFGGRRSEKGSTPEQERYKRANAEALDALVTASESLGRVELTYRVTDMVNSTTLAAIIWRSSKSALIEFMRTYRWRDDEPFFQREIEFLEGTGSKDPEIDNVLVIAPQRRRSQGYPIWSCAGENLSVWSRRRIHGRRFGAISGSQERQIGDYLAGVDCRVEEVSPETSNLRSPRTAVLLVYPIVPTKDALLEKTRLENNEVSIGLGIRFPYNNIPQVIEFGVADPANAEDIVVDVH